MEGIPLQAALTLVSIIGSAMMVLGGIKASQRHTENAIAALKEDLKGQMGDTRGLGHEQAQLKLEIEHLRGQLNGYAKLAEIGRIREAIVRIETQLEAMAKRKEADRV